MNASARMRQRIAILTVFTLFAGLWGLGEWVGGPPRPAALHTGDGRAAALAPPPALPEGRFATLHLADPIDLTEGNTTHRVTRVVVNFDTQTLTLERDELAFDDYGDPTRTGGAEPLVLPVRIRPERVSDMFRREVPNLFEIAPARRFREHLRVVVRPEDPDTCVLVVLGAWPDGNEKFERVLELRRPVVRPDILGDDPQPDRFAFGALGPCESSGGPRLCKLGASGSLDRGGQLSIDRNACWFSPDGRVCGSTLMYFPPTEVIFKPLGPDPANRGRRAFELVPTKPEAPQTPKDGPFILVLGPTELSEHRLVIKRDAKVVQVLSLRNTDRDNHLFMLRKLDSVPADEREAFRALGKAGHYRVVVEVNNGHVVALYHLRGDVGKLDPILARFPHLGSLHFDRVTIPATGLPCLEKLKELRGLSFWSCELTDDGLASVGKVSTLRHLSTFGSKGFTPAGLRHLASLTNLEMLDLRREDAPADAPVFDDGVKHLTGMTRLMYLNVQGLHLTDAGLVHVGRLKTLRELYFSGFGITDAGLRHLDGLTELTAFGVYSGVSYQAITAFRAKRPNLRPW